MNGNKTVIHTDNDRPQKAPSLFAWLGSGVMILVIIFVQIFPRGDLQILRGSGVFLLLLAGIFIFTPFFTLTKFDSVKGQKSYMQSSDVVDQGLYAVTRHPQYLGYIFLVFGFALLSGHWITFLLAIIAAVFFFLQATREEKYCLSKFGETYVQYTQRVPRFNIVLGFLRILQGERSG